MTDNPPIPDDLSQLSIRDLIRLYDSLAPDDPAVDRVANEMQARGIDR